MVTDSADVRLSAVIETCEESLESIFTRFLMWGNPRMVETAFLSYLEVLLVAHGKLPQDKSICTEWVAFCSKRFGVLDPRMLADRFEWTEATSIQQNEAAMIALMRDFRAETLGVNCD